MSYFICLGGQSWTLSSAPTDYYQAIASSSDGMNLAAAAGYGYVYVSTSGFLIST